MWFIPTDQEWGRLQVRRLRRIEIIFLIIYPFVEADAVIFQDVSASLMWGLWIIGL